MTDSHPIHRAVLCIACLILVSGCKEDRLTYSIQSRQNTYESWLLKQRPELKILPKNAIYSYQFTTFHSDGEVLPIVHYYLKAGDWDGMINLTYIIDVDAQHRPIDFKDERITFIGLPARETVPKSAGLENRYFGVYLDTTELKALVDRIFRGDDFDDLREKAAASDQFTHGRLANGDDWHSLRAQQ